MANKPRPSPPPPSTTSTLGIRKDSDAWAAAILALGAGGARWLSYIEHIDFLVSIREEKFKMIFDLWQAIGWWLAIGIGVIWFGYRFTKRGEPHDTGPTWGLVVSCTVIAFVFGSLIAVQSSGGFPQVIKAHMTGLAQIPGVGTVTSEPCIASVDGSRLVSFKKEFKLVLVCAASDPTSDVLSDKKIIVSNPFEIVSGLMQISAIKSPNGDFSTSRGQQLTINFFAVLVPREVEWAKLTTLADMMALGAKVLDPRYYRG